MLLDNIRTISILNTVATAKSLAAAADQLGLSPSAVSKALTRLERELGMRVLHRTTHKVALTEVGNRICEHFRRVAEQLEQAEVELLSAQSSPRGRLRVQLPTTLGRHVILPRLSAFLETYPNLELNVELSERIIDLTKERVEVAVRIGEVENPGLVARWLFRMKYVVCASPAYLERAGGAPRTPEDLQSHRCLAYFNPDTGRYGDWTFSEKGGSFAKTIAGAINLNSAESILEFGLAGEGIVRIADFLAEPYIRENRLQLLLQDYAGPGPDVHALYLPHEARSPNVRIFLRFVQDSIRDGLNEILGPAETNPVIPLQERSVLPLDPQARGQRGKRTLRSRTAR